MDDLVARVRLALEAGGLGTWRWDRRTGEVTWDSGMERLYGLAPGTGPTTFDDWQGHRPKTQVEDISELMERSAATGEPYVFEHEVVWPDGSVHWLHAWGKAVVEDGEIAGAIGCSADFTERKAAELSAAEYATRVAEYAAHEQSQRERLAFLASLSDAALELTDHRDYMAAVVDAAVPRLGDWAVLRYRPEPGARLDTVLSHFDPDRREGLARLRERFGDNPDAAVGGHAVMRTGRAEFVPQVDEEFLARAAGGSHIDLALAREILEDLRLRSIITVPLRTRRGIVGALQLVMSDSGREYSSNDLSLAELAADRVAVALDGMWETHRQRHIAETLQAALLPPSLPQLPGLGLAARYWPTGVGTQVGGDFYDVFATGPGRTAVVIGDVCGTGPDAAAVVGIARHTIRAAARHDVPPVGVLGWLNEAINLGHRHRFATAIYATLTEDPTDPRAWDLVVASGGHPLPVVVRADGRVESVGEPGMLLGVFDEISAEPVGTRLYTGDTVVLYTDGITDRPPPYDIDQATLEAVIGRCATASATADDVLDTLGVEVERLSEGQLRQDDVALLAIRFCERRA